MLLRVNLNLYILSTFVEIKVVQEAKNTMLRFVSIKLSLAYFVVFSMLQGILVLVVVERCGQ